MRSANVVHVVSCHAEGEVGDVIVGGVAPPPGETIREQARYIAEDDTLRRFVLNEPRGGVFRHVNLLVPARDPEADMGFIIMEPEATPPMSGSNSMCVATVLLETGMIPMHEPQTTLKLEAPGGVVGVVADCRDGACERVTVTNVASFASRLQAPLEVERLGTITVDIAYGGDSFVLVDGADLGFAITPDEAPDLVATGRRITAAANQQLGFVHPLDDAWNRISFCQIAGPIDRDDRDRLTMRNTVVIEPGKLDRSPTGTGVSARLAVLRATERMQVGDSLVVESILGSTFIGTIAADTSVGDRAAIVPTISGRAWITGTHQHLLDPTDPWPSGYRLADTWPGG